jgi:hypothetical protein
MLRPGARSDHSPDANLQPIDSRGGFLLRDASLVNEILSRFGAVGLAIVRANGSRRFQELPPDDVADQGAGKLGSKPNSGKGEAERAFFEFSFRALTVPGSVHFTSLEFPLFRVPTLPFSQL